MAKAAKKTDDQERVDAGELGAMMREMRENLGHELKDVAADLRIRLVYLEAIEAGKLSELPGSAYVSGFIRSYSEYLGLDGDEIVRRFRQAGINISGQTPLHLPSPVEEGRLPTAAILIVAAVIAGGVYGGWQYMQSKNKEPVEAVARVPADVKTAAEGKAPAETAPAPASMPAQTAAPAPAASTAAPAQGEAAKPAAPPAEVSPPAASSPAPVETRPAESAAAPAPAAIPEKAPEAAPARPSEAPVSAPAQPAPTEQATAAPPAAERTAPAPAPAPERTATAPAQSAPETTPPASAPAAATESTAPAAPSGENADGSDPDATPAPSAVTAERPAEAPASSSANDTPQVGSRPEAPAAAAPSASATPSSPVGGSRIVIRAVGESYVAVLTSDKQVLFSQLLRSGDSYEVPAGANLLLQTGNAGALRIVVDGKEAPALGPVGEVRSDILLDAESLLAGRR